MEDTQRSPLLAFPFIAKATFQLSLRTERAHVLRKIRM